MHLVFGDEDNIVISWVGRHTEDEDILMDVDILLRWLTIGTYA